MWADGTTMLVQRLRAGPRLLAFRLLLLLDRVTPSGGVPIALYHQVTDTPAGYHIGGHVAPTVFFQQMKRLAKQGYRGITVREYMRRRRENPSGLGKVLVMTFDDAQEDVYRFAFPILKELGFSATVFAVTDYVGKAKWLDPDTYIWSDCQPHPRALHYRFMDWDQVGALHAKGFEVGAHSCTHPQLTELPKARVQEEVGASKLALEKVLGQPVATFCYPFGGFNQNVRGAVVEAGYMSACSTVHDVNRSDTDPFALRRYGIASVTGRAFDVYLTDKYAWYYRASGQLRGRQ
jgi:peptidoglycan/xylan/chitin deacetylase (PgdA/CDA1 family)